MTCTEFQEHVVDLLDAAPRSAADLRNHALREHMAVCAACAARYGELHATLAALEPDARLNASPLLKERIMNRIDSRPADTAPKRNPRMRLWRPALAAAATASASAAPYALATAGPADSASHPPQRANSSFQSESTAIQPADPPIPCAPLTTWPPDTIPTPIPVPIETKTTSFNPRATPTQLSPRTHPVLSLSTTTVNPSWSSNAFRNGTCSLPHRFGHHAVPVLESKMPGTITPTAAGAPSPSVSASRIAVTLSSRLAPDRRLRLCVISPSSSTHAVAVLVPPISTASTCFMAGPQGPSAAP